MGTLLAYRALHMFVSPKKSHQHPDRVDDLIIQVVYYYLPAEVGTAEVASAVIPYTLRYQYSHNPQYLEPVRNCQA